jgi:hypothetical protein
MLSRRAVIGKMAVGAAAALALGAARTSGASTRALAATDDPADDRDGQHGQHASAPAETRGIEKDGPPPAEPVAISSPPPWELVRPLAAGSVLAHGWQLVGLSPVQNGSCVATLQNARGRAHRVHLCRNDGTPQGIVYTRRVDLVVMNEGYRDLPTEERLAQAVAELAHAVAANEAKAPDQLFADLLPHSERVQRFAAAEGPAAYGKLR